MIEPFSLFSQTIVARCGGGQPHKLIVASPITIGIFKAFFWEIDHRNFCRHSNENDWEFLKYKLSFFLTF